MHVTYSAANGEFGLSRVTEEVSGLLHDKSNLPPMAKFCCRGVFISYPWNNDKREKSMITDMLLATDKCEKSMITREVKVKVKVKSSSGGQRLESNEVTIHPQLITERYNKMDEKSGPRPF